MARVWLPGSPHHHQLKGLGQGEGPTWSDFQRAYGTECLRAAVGLGLGVVTSSSLPPKFTAYLGPTCPGELFVLA